MNLMNMSGVKIGRVGVWYESLEKKHPKFINAVQELGKVVRQEGPLDEKTTFNGLSYS